MTDYYELPYEPEEEDYICDNCGAEIYKGEYFYDFEGLLLCEESAREWLEEQPVEWIMQRLGANERRYEGRGASL